MVSWFDATNLVRIHFIAEAEYITNVYQNIIIHTSQVIKHFQTQSSPPNRVQDRSSNTLSEFQCCQTGLF